MVCFSPVGYSVQPTFRALALCRADCSDEGLTLETSATHQIPQATNTPYHPLLIKPVFNLLANAVKTVFFQN